jgi:hypothetical protein
MLAELDTLYGLGYRGHVDFVDDNLIGNKKAVRAFLPHLKAWQEAHRFLFEFSTEASINIADGCHAMPPKVVVPTCRRGRLQPRCCQYHVCHASTGGTQA